MSFCCCSVVFQVLLLFLYFALFIFSIYCIRFTVCDMCVLPFGVITNKNKFKFQVCSLSVSGQWLVGSVAVDFWQKLVGFLTDNCGMSQIRFWQEVAVVPAWGAHGDREQRIWLIRRKSSDSIPTRRCLVSRCQCLRRLDPPARPVVSSCMCNVCVLDWPTLMTPPLRHCTGGATDRLSFPEALSHSAAI